MRLIDRYIGRTVAVHILGVALVLLTIYFFSGVVTEIGRVGKGDYTVGAAMRYSLMLLPRQAYELFPLAALVGTMLGLGALANSSELAVIRAAGVSVRGVLLAVLKTGLLLALLATALGEGVAPPLEKAAKLERATALAQNFRMNTRQGLWARDGNTFINIERLFIDGRASAIALYQFGPDHALRSIVRAHTGHYQGGSWTLFQVTVTTLGPTAIHTEYHEQMPWSSQLNPRVINLVAIKPDYLSALELTGYLDYMRSNGLEARPYELAFWKRLLSPLVTAGMVLLAVPFVLGSMRAVSVGQRVMAGSLIAIGFYLFNAVFSEIALVYAVPPLLAAATPTLVVYGLWAVLMRRVT